MNAVLAEAATAIEEDARESFLRATELDVAVRKPGNVSVVSSGHGMHADLFVRSARAAAGPLLDARARVGARIERAVAASLRSAGCNTNLGIILLCAPIAAAAQVCARPVTATSLRRAIQARLLQLDIEDARAAYRAIAAARPGGLGTATAQDVHEAPSIDLRAAMTLAAGRDSIARQYRDGFADLFDVGLPALGPALATLERPLPVAALHPAAIHAVQRLYLTLLARLPDSHIVRKHGEAVAHTVMAAAQGWRVRANAGERLDRDPKFAAWDVQLKGSGINPGTTADLTVATLMLAGLIGAPRSSH